MNMMLLTMNGHLRPYRSEAIPKRIAPTDRSIRTSVIPQVMSVVVMVRSLVEKLSARSLTVSETVKKSKASFVPCQRQYGFARLQCKHTQVQAMKATSQYIHCRVVSIPRSLMGFSTRSIGGLRVERRVARYLPTLIFSDAGSDVSSRRSVYSGAMPSFFSPDIYIDEDDSLSAWCFGHLILANHHGDAKSPV